MEFKQLESFVALVQSRSFTKAAERLYISQPTISTHIRMLEEELRSSLIVRTTKSLEITPRGWELYECAQKILGLRDDLMKSWLEEERKVIRLGASTIPSAYILPEILPGFGGMYPDVYFMVNQSDSQGVIDGLQAGSFDVGLIGMPKEDEVLTCIPFYQDRMVFITPVNDHFLNLKKQGDVPPETLLKEPLILRENGSGSRKAVERFFESMGYQEADFQVAARINDQESIKNLVAGGLGISVISEKAARNFVAEKRILSFELPEDVAGRYLYVAFHKRYILKPYVKCFIEYLQKFYSFA